MFSVTPEAFDAIYMGSTLGSACLLAHNDVIATQRKGGISTPLIGVVKAAGPGMLPDKIYYNPAFASLDRENPDHAVALENANNNNLTGGTPTTLTLSIAAKRGLVAFNLTGKRLSAIFLKGKHGPYQTKKSQYRRLGDRNPEAHPVNGYAKNKELKKPSLGGIREPARIPHGLPNVPLATTTALETAIAKEPCSTKITSRTTSHDQNILHFLVRFRSPLPKRKFDREKWCQRPSCRLAVPVRGHARSTIEKLRKSYKRPLAPF